MRALCFAVLMVLLRSPAAFACSCIQSGPACQAFWKTDAVFDAIVESIVPTTQPPNPGEVPALEYPENAVSMTVRQAWKGGISPGALEVVTARFGASCGYEFKPGRRYLVFAHKRPQD